ncbi:hypothetical protein, partial [Halomonas citrativorans]|uniref:hypothetical protein n=1 Tax=Halomonas citrativorans TaxID=2742612 RepID=UPI001D01A448
PGHQTPRLWWQYYHLRWCPVLLNHYSMPGASFTTLKELREVLEKECGCKDIGDDSEVLK